MRGKILFLTGLGVGYVFGTKAGREKYEQISRAAAKFWNDPRVQERVDQVEGFVKDKAPEVAEFVSGNAKKAASTVTGRKSSSTTGSGAKSGSTASTSSSSGSSSSS
ncbi:hypothetical protein GCM10009792_19680 [Microcella alkalica]|uniref:Uncharacterized protein YjbJ (UPF0337 family) n=1 Tax=Microcella alkalica TaxID=355930 RepID=A0A839EGA0_9MICO|nr:YtxH domain-containing protein [Microcella alkalica]MBA8848608.1 uncharacterized protein YjbJ (UPF0337 family) [Microcella alkalica]